MNERRKEGRNECMKNFTKLFDSAQSKNKISQSFIEIIFYRSP